MTGDAGRAAAVARAGVATTGSGVIIAKGSASASSGAVMASVAAGATGDALRAKVLALVQVELEIFQNQSYTKGYVAGKTTPVRANY